MTTVIGVKEVGPRAGSIWVQTTYCTPISTRGTACVVILRVHILFFFVLCSNGLLYIFTDFLPLSEALPYLSLSDCLTLYHTSILRPLLLVLHRLFSPIIPLRVVYFVYICALYVSSRRERGLP